MPKRIAAVGAAAVLVLATAVAVFVVGMRTKFPPVVNRVRQLARDVGNPRMLKSAGQPGSSASVIQHIGRSSGKQYQTPVTALPTADGFVIALPYGQTDWLKNILAQGSATLVHQGSSHLVEPTVVPVDTVLHAFSPRERRNMRLFGVDECVLLNRAAPVPTAVR